MRVLAFDQASRTSGYSVFDDEKLVAHGKFTYDDYDFGIRLLNIRNKVISLINTYNPDQIAFEDIQLQNNVVNNVETFKKLAEVFGIIYELVTEFKIPHDIVLASTWKSSLGIKGKDREVQKKNAQLWVLNTFGISASQDECDAICIGAHISKKPPLVEESFDWSE